MRKPVPRSINPKGIGAPPLRLAFLLVLALSGCTTFKPPQISYDDDVPPSPDLPMPADDHARPLHIPPPWTPARGIVCRRDPLRRLFGFFITLLAAARWSPGRWHMQCTRVVIRRHR